MVEATTGGGEEIQSQIDSQQFATEKLIELIKYREEEGQQEARDKFIELLKKLKEAKMGVNEQATGANRMSILMEVSTIFSFAKMVF